MSRGGRGELGPGRCGAAALRLRAASGLGAALVLALSSCSSDSAGAVPPQADGGGGTDADPPAAQAEVGGADDEGKGFVDWSVGPNTPPIIRGPQGGQHIWVSAHARHVYPNKARVAVTMYLDEGGTAKVVSPGRVEMIGMLKGDGDWLIYPGIAAFVKEPCKIYGKNVRVELEVDDLYGRRATDTKWIRPTWDGPCD